MTRVIALFRSGGRIGSFVVANAVPLRIAVLAGVFAAALLLPPPIPTMARVAAAAGFGLLAVYEAMLTLLGLRARLRGVADRRHTWWITAGATGLFSTFAILLLG
jgi:hypothetical protein